MTVITSRILRKSSQGRYSSRRRFKLEDRVSSAPGWEWQRVCNDAVLADTSLWLVPTAAVHDSEDADGFTTDSTLHSDNGRTGIGTHMLLNGEAGSLPEPEKWNGVWPVVSGRTFALPDDTAGRVVTTAVRTIPETSGCTGTGCCRPLLCRWRTK